MNTTTAELVTVDTLADLPLLWERLRQLDFVNLVDQHFPKPPQWKGDLSIGQVLSLVLLYCTSQSDHRLVCIEPWAQQHHVLLSALLGVSIRPNDCHDDRIAYLLERLSQGDAFARLETQLNQNSIRVYDIPTDVLRLDTTTANVHRQNLTDDGLIQFGHSKDDSSRPQLKIAAAVVDPLGMPLRTACLPGNTADDPTYIPIIGALQQSLGKGNRLFVGDCKMASLQNRVFIVKSGERYLCPLSETQLSQAKRREMLQTFRASGQPLQQVTRPGKRADEQPELVAEGFVVEVPMTESAEGSGKTWVERRFMVRSKAYASSSEAALERKLASVEQALKDLPVRKQGKKVLSFEEMEREAKELLAKGDLVGLLSCRVERQVEERRKRGYKGRSERVERVEQISVKVVREESAIECRKGELGWQVYGSNDESMGLCAVVWGYRGQYRIEDAWSRLKGKTLCLTPIYLQDEGRIQGLVHLLSVGLRVLSLMEWEVKKKLGEGKTAEEKTLRGMYPGQAGRKTSSPSAELLLGAFRWVSVGVVSVGGTIQVLLKPLSSLQQRLLRLLGIPDDLYDKVAQQMAILYQNKSEP